MKIFIDIVLNSKLPEVQATGISQAEMKVKMLAAIGKNADQTWDEFCSGMRLRGMVGRGADGPGDLFCTDNVHNSLCDLAVLIAHSQRWFSTPPRGATPPGHQRQHTYEPTNVAAELDFMSHILHPCLTTHNEGDLRGRHIKHMQWNVTDKGKFRWQGEANTVSGRDDNTFSAARVQALRAEMEQIVELGVDAVSSAVHNINDDATGSDSDCATTQASEADLSPVETGAVRIDGTMPESATPDAPFDDDKSGSEDTAAGQNKISANAVRNRARVTDYNRWEKLFNEKKTTKSWEEWRDENTTHGADRCNHPETGHDIRLTQFERDDNNLNVIIDSVQLLHDCYAKICNESVVLGDHAISAALCEQVRSLYKEADLNTVTARPDQFSVLDVLVDRQWTTMLPIDVTFLLSIFTDTADNTSTIVIKTFEDEHGLPKAKAESMVTQATSFVGHLTQISLTAWTDFIFRRTTLATTIGKTITNTREPHSSCTKLKKHYACPQCGEGAAPGVLFEHGVIDNNNSRLINNCIENQYRNVIAEWSAGKVLAELADVAKAHAAAKELCVDITGQHIRDRLIGSHGQAWGARAFQTTEPDEMAAKLDDIILQWLKHKDQTGKNFTSGDVKTRLEALLFVSPPASNFARRGTKTPFDGQFFPLERVQARWLDEETENIAEVGHEGLWPAQVVRRSTRDESHKRFGDAEVYLIRFDDFEPGSRGSEMQRERMVPCKVPSSRKVIIKQSDGSGYGSAGYRLYEDPMPELERVQPYQLDRQTQPEYNTKVELSGPQGGRVTAQAATVFPNDEISIAVAHGRELTIAHLLRIHGANTITLYVAGLVFAPFQAARMLEMHPGLGFFQLSDYW